MMKASEVITGAIDLIRQHGLHKGDYGNTTVGFCTVGALDVAAGWRDSSRTYAYSAFAAAKDLVAEAAKVDRNKVAAWSDAPDTTKEIVLSTLANARNKAVRIEAE